MATRRDAHTLTERGFRCIGGIGYLYACHDPDPARMFCSQHGSTKDRLVSDRDLQTAAATMRAYSASAGRTSIAQRNQNKLPNISRCPFDPNMSYGRRCQVCQARRVEGDSRC